MIAKPLGTMGYTIFRQTHIGEMIGTSMIIPVPMETDGINET